MWPSAGRTRWRVGQWHGTTVAQRRQRCGSAAGVVHAAELGGPEMGGRQAGTAAGRAGQLLRRTEHSAAAAAATAARVSAGKHLQGKVTLPV